MRKLLSILVVLIFICAVFIASVQAASLTEQGENEPGITVSMAPIFTTLKALAKVPDPALKAALHDAVGISQSATLYVEDLEALSGVLELNDLGITDLTGIQHCINIEQLFLNDNELSSVIFDVKKMSKLKLISLEDNNFTVVPKELYNIPKLQTLLMQNNPISLVEPGMKFANFLTTVHLANCELTSFPMEVMIPNLEYLHLANNDIKELPIGFSLQYELKTLNVDNTGLTELPSGIYYSRIVSLSAANNSITEVPFHIDNMGYCEYLNFSGNDITSLPITVGKLGNLRHLNVNYNALTGLPDFDPNLSKIELLYARANNITAIPPTLGASVTIKELDLTLNRLTNVPSDFGSMYFDYCGLSFNYLDISPGSSTLATLQAIGGDVEYMPQIEPPKGLTAVAEENAVALTWNACPEGSFDAGDMQVESYSVYAINGTVEKLGELPATVLTYTHQNPTPDTAYTYRVTVKYKINLGTRGSTRYRLNSSEVSVQTLPAPSPSLAHEPNDTDTETDSIDASSTAPISSDKAASEVDTSDSSDPSARETQPGLPTWAIVLICIVGATVLGAGIFFSIIACKKRKKQEEGEDDLPKDE
ncbi:MAG: hypothetical protein HN389_06680 [Clostridia bacterium]|nr:hypothetical protein [Clostridia bacterium]